MAPRKSQAANVDSAADTGTASIPTNVEGIAITTPTTPALALPAAIAPAADTTPILTSAAIDAARASVASLTAAMALLGESHAAYAAMSEQLDTANGVLALAVADAEIDAEKNAAIASARAAASAAKLPDDVLAVMLQAIEAKYAPVPAPAAPALDTPAPYVGRKPIGPRTADRNAQALAAADADPTVYARAAGTYNAFRKEWAGDLRGVSAVAGTRYVSIAAFAGAGVANKSDYLALVPVLRRYLLSVGLKDGGESAATDAWLFAFGPHAAGAPKGADTLALKFLSGAGVALHSDGRFRLAARGTAGVRFVSSDAAALAAWNGSTPTPAATTPTPPATDAPAATPRVPTPPAAQALPNGGIASTARCQHCTARNFTTNAECSACGASDWQAA